jgi:acyl carrier protein
MSQPKYSEAQILDLIRAALDEVVPDRGDEWAIVELDRTIEELELDSIATMEMVGSLEEKTDTTFPDEELPKVSTLRDLATLVQKGRL